MSVAVLFARRDSVYYRDDTLDVYDIDRDARKWPGGVPVVAHPPCRSWGRLRGHAKPREDERELATWAVDQVRLHGGVLEHPEKSSLWIYANLPPVGSVDAFGGHTYPVDQNWFGHRARKRTWLYVVGVPAARMPQLPMSFAPIERVVAARTGKRKGSPGWLPAMRAAEREHTPPEFAAWLVSVAMLCAR